MEDRVDFLNWLEPDMSAKILMCLEDLSDLVRVSTLSRSWRRFVIGYGLCKQLCIRMFPQLSRVVCVVETSNSMEEHIKVGFSNFIEWERLETEHRVFVFLARAAATADMTNCISLGLCASSTDNYPEESMINTLISSSRVGGRASYWSSKGSSDPTASEALTYILSNFCVITEVDIMPFQAYFQPGSPIYSAKSVRFRVGHSNVPMQTVLEDTVTGEILPPFADEAVEFIWTHTSPEFPMAQESGRLQSFRLPEPVLCIGGILQVELLGRAQMQEADGLFYVCVAFVQVKGRLLNRSFRVEKLEPSSDLVLTYYPKGDLDALLGMETLSEPLTEFVQDNCMPIDESDEDDLPEPDEPDFAESDDDLG